MLGKLYITAQCRWKVQEEVTELPVNETPSHLLLTCYCSHNLNYYDFEPVVKWFFLWTSNQCQGRNASKDGLTTGLTSSVSDNPWLLCLVFFFTFNYMPVQRALLYKMKTLQHINQKGGREECVVWHTEYVSWYRETISMRDCCLRQKNMTQCIYSPPFLFLFK